MCNSLFDRIHQGVLPTDSSSLILRCKLHPARSSSSASVMRLAAIAAASASITARAAVRSNAETSGSAPGRVTDAAEVEAHGGDAQVAQRARGHGHHLVVHAAALGGQRMADDRHHRVAPCSVAFSDFQISLRSENSRSSASMSVSRSARRWREASSFSFLSISRWILSWITRRSRRSSSSGST